MAAVQLARTGVCRIGLVDYDRVEVSNLPRQVFFAEHDVGRRKADAVAQAIAEGNSEVRINVFGTTLDAALAETIVPEYDFVVDALDNM